ncbi:MAG: 50S ribosomal protein L6 [Thermoplasmatota archaeon]
MDDIKNLAREITIHPDVKMTLKEGNMTVKGPKGELTRRFFHPRVKIETGKDKVRAYSTKKGRFEKGLVGTWISHIGNMQKGVTEGFEYKMRIIYSHFPIKTSVKGDHLVIENFLGERHPRRARIVEGVTAKISGDTVSLQGTDKEKVGQTAANIEKASRVKGYDTRVFQDGIYLVSRGD